MLDTLDRQAGGVTEDQIFPRRRLGLFGSFIPVIAALIGYGIGLFAPPLLNDGDTYWHIATGEWILQNGAVPHVDPLSYSFAGSPWVAHEWLADVLMALAYKAGDWNGIAALFGGALALTFGLLAHHLTRWLSPLAALTVLVLGAECISPSLLARPHLLALPVLALWTVGLLQARRKGTAPSVLLLPLMVIWADLHGSFAFGLALALPFAAEAVIEAGADRLQVAGRWSLFIAAAMGAALLTPQGWHGLLFPFQLVDMRQLSSVIEWRATDFSTLQPLEIALVALLYVAFSRGVRIPPLRLLLLLGLLHLALHHGRHQMLAGTLGALILAEPLSHVFGRRAYESIDRLATRWVVGWVALALLLTVIRVTHPLVRADDPVSPITALHQVPVGVARQPVFNDYQFGGYLIFRDVKPLIDGRADMYGDDFVSSYVAAYTNSSAFETMAERYGIRWTILRTGSPAVAVLDALPGWRRLYADNVAVVHVWAGDGP